MSAFPDAALESDLPETVKDIIRKAPVYGEGRGMKMDVRDPSQLPSIQEMIRIKMDN